MGWTVLYIAFGVVALWLLGEVLLQYKARLRWRLLAFVGFLGVVIGVLMPSVVVIGIGAIAFAVGQTYVTLSFRRGFSTGWAIGGKPGESGRRRRPAQDAQADPTLEVSDLEEAVPAFAAAPANDYGDGYSPDGYAPDGYAPNAADGPGGYGAEGYAANGYGSDGYGYGEDAYPGGYPTEAPPPVYQPQPLPDDTGQYGVYSDSAYANATTGGYGTGYDDGYGSYTQGPGPQDPGAPPPQEDHSAAYAAAYDPYGGDQQYAAYSDPYLGNQQYEPQYDQQGYGQQYDPYGGQWDQGQGQYAAPYADPGQQYGETPPGGVWVPQQREGGEPQVPPEPGAPPYQPGYDTGYDGQYRY